MKKPLLLGVALLSVVGTGHAADDGHVQVSAVVGQTRLHVDGDRLYGGETLRVDAFMTGLTLGYRMPSGFLAEAGVLYSAHDGVVDFEVADDVELYHYTAALGWQFDLERWRLTPKFGVARSKLNSEGRRVLNDNGGRTDKLYSTVPFGEVSLVHRLGDHWAVGAHFRDTFEEFGHARSYGFMASFNF